MNRKRRILIATSLGVFIAALVLNSTDVLLLGGQKGRVVESLAAVLREFYIVEEDGNEMADLVQARHASGHYIFAVTREMLWKKINSDLQSVCDDQHLIFVSSPDMVAHAENMIANVDIPNEADRTKSEADNHGIGAVRMIGEQVGYLSLTRFANPIYGRETLLTTLSQIDDARIIVIDLRQNRGGWLEMAQVLFSYLTPPGESVLMESVYFRYKDEKQDFWTLADVPSRPVAPDNIYILTSSATFSAGEGFAYSMKHHGKAVVVGEQTSGAAHAVEWKVIEDHYVLRVPVARGIHPVTGKDWEGTGVTPDVSVPSSQALDEVLRVLRQRQPQSNNVRQQGSEGHRLPGGKRE